MILNWRGDIPHQFKTTVATSQGIRRDATPSKFRIKKGFEEDSLNKSPQIEIKVPKSVCEPGGIFFLAGSEAAESAGSQAAIAGSKAALYTPLPRLHKPGPKTVLEEVK